MKILRSNVFSSVAWRLALLRLDPLRLWERILAALRPAPRRILLATLKLFLLLLVLQPLAIAALLIVVDPEGHQILARPWHPPGMAVPAFATRWGYLAKGVSG
jgi:hypothetical protein